MTAPLLQIDSVSRAFGGGRTLIGRPKARIHALQNVSLNVERGETLAPSLVGFVGQEPAVDPQQVEGGETE